MKNKKYISIVLLLSIALHNNINCMEKKSEYDNTNTNNRTSIEDIPYELFRIIYEMVLYRTINDFNNISIKNLRIFKKNIRNSVLGMLASSKHIITGLKYDEGHIKNLVTSLIQERLSDLIERDKDNYQGKYKRLSQDELNSRLMLSICSSDFNKTLQLILAGANVNMQDRCGDSVLIKATSNNKKEMVELLIASGVDVNIKDEDGYTALMWAAARGHKKIVKLLIDNGANVDIQDEYGHTALMWAAREYKEIVKLLIDNGANINTQSKTGTTAFQIAKNNKNANIIELLKDAGARD